ncbi:MAG TPA: HAD-IC family P-type ATPase, partial [Verrucomicrobiota bacterium]|nr:HAD-IC family P-type ATPase [Verrucomicrobiota bacterium]
AAIEIEIVKPVSQSYLASLWGHEAFQKGEDDLNTLTNRYSRRFTLLVVAVALGAAAFWIAGGDAARGIKAFTSVLIVACPCALALAAPFTLGTAQRILAKLGVFLKNAHVVERIAKINAIVFDKTGTLTAAGASSVTFRNTEDFRSSVHGLSVEEQSLVFSLTRHSTHPHSVRIADSLAARNLPERVQSFRETPGCGIEGVVNGRTIRIGSQSWVARSVGQASRLSQTDCQLNGDRRDACPTNGSTVHVAIDGNYRGTFLLGSSLRPETGSLLRGLAARFDLALLSGDNERERERFRALFGDKATLHFNQSPLDKLEFIHGLQRNGRNVMMVGDGLNDAGALRQSDVGVAVIENIGAFSPASDVIMDAARVPQLERIVAFARRSARIVRISFAISAAYNVVGVSIAAAGLLSPVVCAVLMPVSSVSVVLFACGMTTWAARRSFGPRWQSKATTPLCDDIGYSQSGVALRFPPHSKSEVAA